MLILTRLLPLPVLTVSKPKPEIRLLGQSPRTHGFTVLMIHGPNLVK